MNLYTKHPNSRKVIPIDVVSGNPIYSQAYVLYPNEPTDVPQKVAKELLKQYPRSVSTVPYDKLDPTNRWGKQPEGIPEDFGDSVPPEIPVLPMEEVTDGSFKSKEKEPTPPQGSPLGDAIPDADPHTPKDNRLVILKEIADKGVDTLSNGQVTAYAEKLGIKAPPRNMGVTKRRKILDQRCQEIFEEIHQ